jgi:hypothetical protein
MSATTLHSETVRDFVAAVRAALSDLPAEEVDELTDGLEASLAERLEDTGGELEDPASYAAELRSAAGLAARGSRIHTSAGSILTAAAADVAAAFRTLYDYPITRRIAGILMSIRPLWWLFRAFVFYVVITAVFGLYAQFNLATFCIGVGAFVVSVQFGRGKWLPRSWMKRTLTAVNVLAIIAVPIVLLAIPFVFGQQYDTAYAAGASDESASQQGLYYNGRQITNILPYSVSGQPLSGVQLFDQDDRPLYTVADPTSTWNDDEGFLVPNRNVVGRSGWNVYPLLEIPQREINVATGQPQKGAVAIAPKRKYGEMPGLANQPTPTPTPAPTSTPKP